MIRVWNRLSMIAAVVVAAPASADAHAFDPNTLQLHETTSGAYRVTWTTSTPAGDSRPELLAPCVVGEPSKAGPPVAGARTTQRWRVDCGPGGLLGAVVRFEGPAADTDTIVRLQRRDGSRWTTVARAGGDTITIPSQGRGHGLAVARRYLTLGLEHIALGIDHLLFVLALWLLVPGRRALVGTITAFTVGHSITLALATVDLVTPRAAPVEVLIALSIVLLARQLCLGPRSRSADPRRRQTWAVALVFGLLHGFGFAGALKDLEVPSAQILLALGAFNLGVELGQLGFVLLLAGIRFAVERRLRSFNVVGRHLVAYAMGATATVWAVQRAFQLGV